MLQPSSQHAFDREGRTFPEEASLTEIMAGLLPAIIALYEPDTGRLRFMNDQVTSLLGFSREETTRWKDGLSALLYHEDAAGVKAALEEYAAQDTSGVFFVNCRFNSKKEEYRYFSLEGKAAGGESNGAPRAVLLVAHDRTDMQACKQEQEAFAYAASHDLHAPLRKITIFTEWMRSKTGHLLDKEAQMYLSRIQHAAGDMKLLLDGLLEFSEADRHQAPFEKTDLNRILEEVKKEAGQILEEAQATITAGDLPSPEAIPVQMKRLFFHLIHNAVRFAKENVPPHIEIAAQKLSKNEMGQYRLTGCPFYKIEFKDNGIGFEEKYAAECFRMFERINEKAAYPGAGVGLTVCKRIVENHRGRIFAAGNPGTGAVFTILLPERQEQLSDKNLLYGI